MIQVDALSPASSRARDFARFGGLWLLLFAVITLGAAQASSRPARCTSDRDCQLLRNAVCGSAGICVEREKSDPKPSAPTASACASTKCASGTFCVEKSGTASCVDPCEPNPCQNGGSCDGESAAVADCTCTAGYFGDYCELDVNDCMPSPCQNNGACVDMVNSYTCECAAGWTGTDCQTLIP